MDYRKLKVWELSLSSCFLVLEQAESCRVFVFNDQIIRSSLSVPSNIAEGMVRPTAKQQLQFLNYARASNAEMETQILVAQHGHYFSADACSTLLQNCARVGVMLFRLMQKIESR